MNLKKYPLPKIEYFQTEYHKNLIVLHHTVSDGENEPVVDWFAADHGKSQVAVAYVVGKDGEILEAYDPKYWGWHTGTGIDVDRRSIGIEIVNAGSLIKKADGFYTSFGKKMRPEDVVTVDHPYRGCSYFTKYTSMQMDAVNELLEMLIKRFNIKKQFSNSFDFDYKYRKYEGVCMHVNLLSTKADLDPAINLKK